MNHMSSLFVFPNITLEGRGAKNAASWLVLTKIPDPTARVYIGIDGLANRPDVPAGRAVDLQYVCMYTGVRTETKQYVPPAGAARKRARTQVNMEFHAVCKVQHH